MILKIETKENNAQAWRVVQVSEIDYCGYTNEEDCSFNPRHFDTQDIIDLTDLRNPNRLCENSAAGHFLQIIVDRKKVYWANGQVFLMNDIGKTIDKLY